MKIEHHKTLEDVTSRILEGTERVCIIFYRDSSSKLVIPRSLRQARLHLRFNPGGTSISSETLLEELKDKKCLWVDLRSEVLIADEVAEVITKYGTQTSIVLVLEEGVFAGRLLELLRET